VWVDTSPETLPAWTSCVDKGAGTSAGHTTGGLAMPNSGQQRNVVKEGLRGHWDDAGERL
jgi:hypothetical protein